MNKKDRIRGLRQLRRNAAGQEDFLRSAADHGLIVSFSQGRRLWHQLAPEKEDEVEVPDSGQHGVVRSD